MSSQKVSPVFRYLTNIRSDLENAQIVGHTGRRRTAALAFDHFRQTVYLLFLDFVLIDRKERFIFHWSCFFMCQGMQAASSIDNGKDAKQGRLFDLVQLHEDVLSAGDTPSDFES